ncbi:MAG: VanZ family protein [Candidatus Kerfeldbacteria bacterium]|nr:VanZ family protein [Candidatus Kerfeldbacteria bacterium]
MTLSQQRLWAWVYVSGWMTVIFIWSSIPDLRSGLLPLWDIILRKIAHLAEYAILGGLMFRAFEVSGLPRARAVVLAAVLSAGYAGIDEWHQTFVPGRHGAPVDAAIDLVGVLSGLAIRRRMTAPSSKL